jgi:uncharacterized membrane protein
MIRFEVSVRIARPIDDVFAVVADPLSFPDWNSAVQSVRIIAGARGQEASRYLMVRDLPGGPAENELEVISVDAPEAFAIRTNTGPTPFVYRYRLRPDARATVLHLDAEVELPGPRLLAPIAERAVKRGVEDNFAALRRNLEAASEDR